MLLMDYYVIINESGRELNVIFLPQVLRVWGEKKGETLVYVKKAYLSSIVIL